MLVVTYGGTTVPIDDVRSITNFSGGKMGSEIVKCFLSTGPVTSIRHKKSVNPFELRTTQTRADLLDKDINDYKKLMKLKDRHTNIEFDTYDEYKSCVDSVLDKANIFISCAAVSDFGVEKQSGKIHDEQILKLNKLEKILPKIRERRPDIFLVGFKLCAGVKDKDLLDAAKAQLDYCDMVVANHREEVGNRIFVIAKSFTNMFQHNITQRLCESILHEHRFRYE